MLTAGLIAALIAGLVELFFNLLLMLDQATCYLVYILYSIFEVFGGMNKVQYGDNYDYLINIFFTNSTVNTVFWGMALIGIVMCFGFTIMAVVKKIFDIDDKMKSSLGGILTNMVKTIFTILLINFIVVSILNVSNTLMQQVVQLFNSAELINQPTEITFDDEDYATMARILNTIGNYSLNPSRDSKYNINTCFNEIREDMQILQKKGVFNFSYLSYEGTSEDENGALVINYTETEPTWQSALVKIARAHSLAEAQPIDESNEELTKAIIDCMNNMETNPNFAPLTEYKTVKDNLGPKDTPIDVIIFLAGSTTAARNEAYNTNVSIFDDLRYDYIRPNGKSIYDSIQVKRDFDIYGPFDHIMVILVALFIAYLFLNLIINCAARIFNMVLLYLMAPPFIAVTPFDEGEKAKQWWTAFIIQTFSVFGSVIAIRLLMVFIPIIFGSDLVLFPDSSLLNYLSKVVMLVAITVAVEQAAKLVTGILANNAGMQSLYASDVGGAAMSRMKSTASTLAGITGTVTGLKAGANWAGSKFKHSKMGSWMGMGAFSKEGLERAYQDKEREQKAAAAPKEGGGENKEASAESKPEATSPITMANQGGFSINSSGAGGGGNKQPAKQAVGGQGGGNAGGAGGQGGAQGGGNNNAPAKAPGFNNLSPSSAGNFSTVKQMPKAIDLKGNGQG